MKTILCPATAGAGDRGGDGRRRRAASAGLREARCRPRTADGQHRASRGCDHVRQRTAFALPFTQQTSQAAFLLANLQPGDNDAAILDAVAFAIERLRDQPTRFRRAIVLLSETVDQSSKTSLRDALRLIGNTNTAVYSFGFSSARDAVKHENSKFNRPDEPGPVHGCFSKDGTDAEYVGHYGKQALDCISELAPPLRIGTMAYLAADEGLRRNTSQSIAELTGGMFRHFENGRDLTAGLSLLARDLPNYYVLSFRPFALTPGPHALRLAMKDRPSLSVTYRTEYWLDSDSGQ